MLAILVTYGHERAIWAAAIAAQLLTEDVDNVILCNNNSQSISSYLKSMGLEFEEIQDPLEIDGARKRGIRLIVFGQGLNLGAGGARNCVMVSRRSGEPFIRIDDDWIPTEHGWVDRFTGISPGIMRIAPEFKMEPSRDPPTRRPKHRSPDCCGPIWIVSGELADALGAFHVGFGKTLLDDLEYSRRALEWGRRNKKDSILEVSWPIRDLCGEAGIGSTPWDPPWDLFISYADGLKDIPDLFVPYDQPDPGYLLEQAGLPNKETK